MQQKNRTFCVDNPCNSGTFDEILATKASLYQLRQQVINFLLG